MKQPDLYYFETIKLTSQALSKFTDDTCLWLVFSIFDYARDVIFMVSKWSRSGSFIELVLIKKPTGFLKKVTEYKITPEIFRLDNQSR